MVDRHKVKKKDIIMKVEPYNTRLCQGNAYWMAVLSRLSYYDSTDKILAELHGMPNGLGFESVKSFSNKSSQAIFVEHKDYLTMAFRGTDEFGDWIDNLKLGNKKLHGFEKCHGGFLEATNDIWDDIDAVYKEARTREKRPLFITGHSLGGAMATIAATKLLHESRPFISVYTFGQPRVLTEESATKFDASKRAHFYRFQNNNDIVSRVPARAGRYKHVGDCVYITSEGKIMDEPGFWYRFVDTFEGAVDKIKEHGFESITHLTADHNIPRYEEAIRECRDFPTQ